MIKVKGSDNLKKFIKKTEGFRPNPYDDLGVPAIGYGQRNFDPKLTQVSKEQADAMLSQHLEKLESEVGKRIKRDDLSQGQVDAILDASYNMGIEKLEKYNFFDRVNKGDAKDITGFFNTANKAKVGGKLVPLPGLVSRGKQRAEWWQDSTARNTQRSDIDIAIDDALMERGDPTDDIDDAISFSQDTNRQDLDGDIDSAIDASLGIKNSGAGIQNAADMADFADFDYVNQAARLAKKIGVSQEDAEAALLDDDYDNIVVRAESDIISNAFPKTAEFMATPENYPLIARNLEAAKKMEILTSYDRGFWESMGTAAGKNALATEKYANILALTTGLSSPEEFAKEHKTINAEMASTEGYGATFDRHIKKLAKSINRSEAEVAQAYRDFDAAIAKAELNVEDKSVFDRNMDTLFATLKQYGVVGEAVVDKILAVADSSESRQAFLIQQTESLTGTLSSYFGMIVGGGLGLLGGPVTTKIGATGGAALTSGIFAYAEKIDTELQRKLKENPDLNIAAFVQTPEFQEISDGAKIYAGIQGSFDAISTLTLGKLFKGKAKAPRAIQDSLIKRFSKGTLDKAVGVAKEGASQAVQEGVQQATSDKAYNIYVGRSGPEEDAKIVANSIEEATGAFGPGAIAGPSVYYGAKLLNKTAKTIPSAGSNLKKTARKIAPMMKGSGQAMKDYAKSVNMAGAIKAFKEKGGKLEDYVRSLLKKQRTEEQKAEQRQQEQEKEQPKDANVSDDEVTKKTVMDEQVEEETVTVDSRVLSVLLEQEGIDPAQFFVDMGQSEYDTYKSNSGPGQTVTVPRYKWEISVAEFPEISAIAKYNNNEYTALEGEQISDAVREKPEQFIMPEDVELERRPDRGDGEGTTFKEEGPTDETEKVQGEEQGIDSLPPQIEDPELMSQKQRKVADQPPTMEQLEAEGVMEEPVLRQVELRSQLQNQDERDILKKLVAQLRAATNRKTVDIQEADMLAELHFQHLRNRAKILGKTVKEIADENYFTALTKQEEFESPGLGGYFSTTPGRIYNSFIALRKGKLKGGRTTSVRTAIHEMGHLYLHEMAIDWDTIHNIPEENLTAEQREYKFAMDALAEEFGPKMRQHLDKVDVTKLSPIEMRTHLMLISVMDKDKETYGINTLKPLVDYGRAADKDPMFNELLKAIHESWAQTTEKYIFEGKFKNSKMRRVLESLRRYISKFAEAVASSYPQYPALDIDAKMERVFDAIFGATDAIERVSYPMFPNLTFDPSVFGPDGESIVEAIEESYSDQIAEVYSKVFTQNINDREKKLEAFLDAAEQEAESNLVDKLFSVARRTFDESYDKFKKGEIEVDPRLTFESVAEFLFNGDESAAMIWKKTLGNQFVSGKKKKASMTIPELMTSMGINDTNQMREVLENASNYEFFVQREANKILKRMNPILKTDEEIHQITLDTMSTYKKDKYLKKTLKIMGDKALPQLKKLVKQGAMPANYIAKRLDSNYLDTEAIKVLQKSKMKLAKPKNLLAQSNAEGKKAADRLGKQQFFDAFEAKVQQAIKYRAFQIAQDLSKNVTKTEMKIMKIVKMNQKVLAKTHDIDVIKYLKTIMPMVLGDKEGRHLLRSLPDFTKDMLFNSENFSDEMVDSVNRAKEDFLESIGNKQPQDMTYKDYSMLLNFWRTIIAVAKSGKFIENEEVKANALEVAEQTAAIIGANNVESSVFDEIAKGKLTGESLFQSLLGNSIYFDTDMQTLIKDFTNSSSKTEFEFNASRQRIVDLLKKAEKKSGDMRGITDIIKGIGFTAKKPKPIKLKNSNVVLENGIYDVIMILLNMGSDSNLQRLAENGLGPNKTTVFEFDFGLGDYDFDNFNKDMQDLADQGVLKKEHIDLVKGIHGEFKALYPHTKNAVRKVDGYEIGEVKARPIDTPFGRIDGGYYPLVYENRPRIAAERSGSDIFSPTNDEAIFIKDFYPAQDRGFTNKRVSKFDSPLSNDFSRLTSHIQQQHKIAWMRIPAHNLGKVLSNPLIENAVNGTFDKAYRDILLPWYDRMLAQQHTKYDSTNEVNTAARFLRRGTSVAIFLGNFWSVGKQYIGLIPALRIAGKEMIGNGYRLSSSLTAFREAVGRAEKESIFMKNRRKEYARSITKGYESLEVEQGLLSKSAENTEKIAFILMQKAQNHVDMLVWDTVFEKTGSAAKADDAVKKSQGSTAIEDLSNIQFGDDAKKLFVQFVTPVIGQFEQIFIAERESRNLDVKGRAAALAPVVLMSAVIPGLLFGAIAKFRWGDEEETYAESMTRGAIRETMNSFYPLAGDFVYSLFGEGRISFSPTLDIITRSVPKAGSAAKNVLRGVELTEREFSSLTSLATIFSGGSAPLSIVGWANSVVEYFKSDGSKRRDVRLRRDKLKRIKDRNRRRDRRSNRQGLQ